MKYNPVQTTPFILQVKLKAKFWSLVNNTFFKYSPFFARKYRIALVKLFGGKVDWSCSLHRNSIISHPWNLKMGKLSSLAEFSWVYCLDKIEIGEKCCIGKDVYLLTGSHEINSYSFNLITFPIFIGDGVWIATRANVLPNVSIGSFSVVASGSLVVKNVEPYSIVGGNPAKFIKKRVLNG